MAKKSESNNYVNNAEFLETLKKFQEVNDDTSDWFKKIKPKNEAQELFKERKAEEQKARINRENSETPLEKKQRKKELLRLKDVLGNVFLSITEGLLKKPNFANYDYFRKQEMTSDALYYMVNYIDRYDVERPNPFAYFTQIAFNAFLQHINKTKKKDETFTPLTYIENLDSPESKIVEGVYDD